MTTHSGRSYKSTKDPPTTIETATPTASNATPPPATPTMFPPGEIIGLVEFMRGMLQDRADELRKYQEQNDKRFHAMAQQVEMLARIVADHTGNESKRSAMHQNLPVSLTVTTSSRI